MYAVVGSLFPVDGRVVLQARWMEQGKQVAWEQDVFPTHGSTRAESIPLQDLIPDDSEMFEAFLLRIDWVRTRPGRTAGSRELKRHGSIGLCKVMRDRDEP